MVLQRAKYLELLGQSFERIHPLAKDDCLFSTLGNFLKIGAKVLQFVDLEVPMAGIPIQVIRSYDSRNKTKGDFKNDSSQENRI